jgi:hypothetical protein
MKLASALIGCLSVVLSTSCGGADLGDCDRAKLGGAAVGAAPQPYPGQILLQSSCDGGRCHGASAQGLSRSGAPAGLDFNVVANSTSDADRLAARRAFGVVSNNIEEIWEEIDNGTMPPPPPAGAGAMNGADKEVIRNWLACGAPMVEAPVGDPSADTWTRVFAQLSTQCLVCHSTASAAAGGGFILGDTDKACDAYKNVVDKPAQASGPCSGRTLVKPNAPDDSVLVQKLTAMNVCGSPMPPGASAAMPFAASNATLVSDLRTWIMSGAPAPAGCN